MTGARRVVRAGRLAVVVGVAACGSPTTPSAPAATSVEVSPGGSAPNPSPASPTEQTVSPRRDAVLHFEDIEGRPFPYPLVRGRVRGVDTRLIVDTGASHTVMDVWLLEQLGVELVGSAQPGEGHAGERVATMTARSPHLEIEGWGHVPGDVLAARLPAVFRDLGLGGVVSPQSLASTGEVVVVDLPAASLRMIARDEALSLGAPEGLGSVRPCRVGGDPPGVVFIVEGLVQGQPARLVVDSGAEHSNVLAESAAGRRLVARAAPGEASYTVSGRVQGQRVDGVTLSVGGVTTRLDLGIMPGAPSGACPRDGHLGLDVLRRCVLMVSPSYFGADCSVP